MKENRKLYAAAIAGAVICFAGDVLLGAFAPADDFGSSLLCIDFSHDWAETDPLRFALAGFCGTVALIMMFFGFLGIYLRMRERKLRGAGWFLFSAFLFTAAGTLYHNVFAIAAYV